ncbi:MAG: hypothetical protein V3R26_00935 [Hyphomicrobium sp.]
MKDTPNAGASLPPILRGKIAAARSEFTPENLLREARRQKAITVDNVPEVCILDPDGDMVRHLIASNSACRHPGWACYTPDFYSFTYEGVNFGIVGLAGGAENDGRTRTCRRAAASQSRMRQKRDLERPQTNRL